MEHKNMRNMVFLGALFLVLMHSALAENSTRGDYVSDFAYNWGAKMRLLQLENAITRNMLWGREIVAAIKTQNASLDTTELESILTEFEAIKEEVSNTTPVAGEEGAQKFVDMKEDAIRLTTQFRETAKSLLKPEDANALRKRLLNIQYHELKELHKSIEEKRIQYNYERISGFLEAIEVNNPSLLEEMQAGNATKKDIKDALKESTKNQNMAKKAQIALIIGEFHRKDKIFLRTADERVMRNQSERIHERMRDRLEKAEAMNISEKLLDKMQKRIEKFENRAEGIDRFENRTGYQIDKFQNMTGDQITRVRNKTEDQIGKFQDRTDDKIERFWNKSEDNIDRIQNRSEEFQKMWDRIAGDKK